MIFIVKSIWLSLQLCLFVLRMYKYIWFLVNLCNFLNSHDYKITMCKNMSFFVRFHITQYFQYMCVFCRSDSQLSQYTWSLFLNASKMLIRNHSLGIHSKSALFFAKKNVKVRTKQKWVSQMCRFKKETTENCFAKRKTKEYVEQNT